MVHGYREAEHHLFGSTTTLPGESNLLHSELGVEGLNMGQRVQLRHEAMKDINNPSADTSQSDLAESLMSKYNPQEEQ